MISLGKLEWWTPCRTHRVTATQIGFFLLQSNLDKTLHSISAETFDINLVNSIICQLDTSLCNSKAKSLKSMIFAHQDFSSAWAKANTVWFYQQYKQILDNPDEKDTQVKTEMHQDAI